MRNPELGDTVDLVSKLLFGNEKRHRGEVTGVATDGRITADFPQPPYAPMRVTALPDEFVLVTTGPSLRDQIGWVTSELENTQRERDSLARRCAARFEETQKLRDALDKIRELHTESVAGFCPSCFRPADVSETDDGLVAYPCPTLGAIQSVIDLASLATRPNPAEGETTR